MMQNDILNRYILLLLFPSLLFSQEYIKLDKEMADGQIEVILIPIHLDGSFSYESIKYIGNNKINTDINVKYYGIGISINGIVKKIDDEKRNISIAFNRVSLGEWKEHENGFLPVLQKRNLETEIDTNINTSNSIENLLLDSSDKRDVKLNYSIQIILNDRQFTDGLK